MPGREFGHIWLSFFCLRLKCFQSSEALNQRKIPPPHGHTEDICFQMSLLGCTQKCPIAPLHITRSIRNKSIFLQHQGSLKFHLQIDSPAYTELITNRIGSTAKHTVVQTTAWATKRSPTWNQLSGSNDSSCSVIYKTSTAPISNEHFSFPKHLTA